MQKIELTEKEEMMVKCFRAIGEVPANVILWYIAGKGREASAKDKRYRYPMYQSMYIETVKLRNVYKELNKR
jgi:hypothetical protein